MKFVIFSDYTTRSEMDRSTATSRRRPLIVGSRPTNSKIDSNICNIAAAKPIIKTSVFYAGNIDSSVSTDKLRKFVSDMSVNVISCFETKPRRRRGYDRSNDRGPDHKAFRLCIQADDSEKMLDASKWPAFVSILQLYFKPSHRPDSDNGKSNSGGQASKNHCEARCFRATVCDYY